jgi:hypothetical protein
MATKEPMSGWIGFAAIMMLVVGMLTFFEGLIAVIRDNYYVLTPQQIIVFDTTTWGWIMLIWGTVLVLAGLGLGSGAGWARWLAVVLAVGNILGQLGFVGSSAYPLWALTAVTLNIIVIYALTARWEGYPQQARAV